MFYSQKTVYNYTRVKDIEYPTKRDILFLFVELSISRVQVVGEQKRHREITVFSKIERTPLNEAPKVYDNLPLGDYFTEVSKNEFEKLEQLAKDDFVAFASYIK